MVYAYGSEPYPARVGSSSLPAPTVIIKPIKTSIFKERGNLADFIGKYAPKIKSGSILAVTSKIVALAEGSVVRAANPRAREALIRAESDWQLQAKGGKITLKDGLLMWNAGVDESNAKGNIILLPKDSFATARKIRSNILQNVRIRKLGVIITDSRVLPLRAGVVGVALGYAGFKGVRDYRGKKDLFGRKLKFTQTNVADSLATAAILAMGEGSERQPLAVIEDAPVEFTDGVNRRELLISLEDDMYRPLFKTVPRKKK